MKTVVFRWAFTNTVALLLVALVCGQIDAWSLMAIQVGCIIGEFTLPSPMEDQE